MYREWCAREAILKSAGVGLAGDITTLKVRFKIRGDLIQGWCDHLGVSWRVDCVSNGRSYVAAIAQRDQAGTGIAFEETTIEAYYNAKLNN